MSKKKRYTITLTPEIAEEFRNICSAMNLPVSTAINKLIERVVTLNCVMKRS
jgi:antitoxin component of RelBE/YafQ-DinJ toxin-antitoxin module